MHNTQPTYAIRIRPRKSRGFTLTELLVVIAIISMLVALTSVGVMRALNTAKQTRIKTEVDQLDAAFKAYKEKYGAYPPSFVSTSNAGLAGLKQHIARAFPRYDISQLSNDLTACGIQATNRPDQAVFFWLRGFSSDPTHPFVSLNDKLIANGVEQTGVTVKRTPLYDFDPSRLVACPVNAGDIVMPSYFPAGLKVQSTPSASNKSQYPNLAPGSPGAPYLYWFSGNYDSPNTTRDLSNGTEARPSAFNTSMPDPAVFQNAGIATPYWNDINANSKSAQGVDQNENWANPESFQIVACGTDGKYGNPNLGASGFALLRMYPGGANYDTSADLADDDNCTNFCDRARIGDARP